VAKRSTRPAKKFKSFSELHGSRSDVFKGVGGDQLGHDQQLPTATPIGQSPLINPGQPGHPMDPGRIGQAMGNNPSGEDFY
jgi:hypothetical protein